MSTAYHPPIPAWFDPAKYLDANKDVAADAYFGTHPWDHWISSGFLEGRKLALPAPVFEKSYPANWCFAPFQYGPFLFWPISDNGGTELRGNCYIKVFTGQKWVNNFTLGPGTEDIVKLVEYLGRMYVIPESNDAIYCKPDPGAGYVVSKDLRGKPHEYGCFDAAVLNGKLYVPIAGYDPSPLHIWEHDGAAWKIVKSFVTWSEKPTAWSAGADGQNLYVGIGGFARGTTSHTAFDGLWAMRADGWVREDGCIAQSLTSFMGSMFAGGNAGEVKRRTPSGWVTVLNTGARFVVSLAVVGGFIYAGCEAPARVFRSADGNSWQLIREIGGEGPCYIGGYNGRPVVSWWKNNVASIGWI